MVEDVLKKFCEVLGFDSFNKQQTATLESCGARMNKGGINQNTELKK